MADKVKLMVVEDNENTRNLIQKSLENNKDYDFELTMFPDAPEAIRHVEDGYAPDVILSDWMMPKMSGLNFCNTVRHIEGMENIPFILLTGIEDQEYALKAKEANAEYMVKPFFSGSLVDRVRKLLADRV
jgi:CheY-like chemotaxis protein